MILKSLWSQCVIGSTFIHLGLFIVIVAMSPVSHVAMNAVDGFIVETCDARLSEPPSAANTDTLSRSKEASQLQLPHQDVIMASSPAGQSVIMKASPAKAAAEVSDPQLAQSLTPSITVGNAAAISQLAAGILETKSGNMPSAPLNQHHNIAPIMTMWDIGSPRFIHREIPVYPVMARKLGKEGKVVLRLALDAQGKLQGIDTVESNGFGFAEAASAAIRKSTFEPAVSNGNTIASLVLVPIKFVLY